MSDKPTVYLATQSSWRRSALYGGLRAALGYNAITIISTWPERMDKETPATSLRDELERNLSEIAIADALVFLMGPECRETYAEIGYGYLLKKRMLFVPRAGLPLPLCAYAAIESHLAAIEPDLELVPSTLRRLLSRPVPL